MAFIDISILDLSLSVSLFSYCDRCLMIGLQSTGASSCVAQASRMALNLSSLVLAPFLFRSSYTFGVINLSLRRASFVIADAGDSISLTAVVTNRILSICLTMNVGCIEICL